MAAGNGHIQEHEADLFTPQPLAQQQNAVDYSHMIKTLSAWRYVLNARLLALFALMGSLLGFGFTMYDATPLRLWGLGIYAILVQGPILALYLRKG